MVAVTKYNFQKEVLCMASVQKTMDSSSLSEVIDRILDKGVVIDAWARVSLVGIEILSVEARVVVASVDTYLKYAEAVGLTAAATA
jgi:gas vesicle structural protein